MPPLTDEHGEPLPVHEAFDTGGGEEPADAGGHEEPAPADAQRSRSSTLLGVVPFAVPTRGSSPGMAIAAAEEAAQEATVTEVASIVVAESLSAAAAPAVAAVVVAEAPAMPAAPVAMAVAVAPVVYAPVLDDTDEELEPLPRAAFAWWHIALAGGALATLASAIGVAALT
jgi:hypothetical protein